MQDASSFCLRERNPKSVKTTELYYSCGTFYYSAVIKTLQLSSLQMDHSNESNKQYFPLIDTVIFPTLL